MRSFARKMHMAYGMCRAASFRCTSHTECALRPPLFAQEIVRTRTISLGRLCFGRWMEGGAPVITTTAVHSKHPRPMRILLMLVGRILGLACFITPMFPSQPFPFENPNLYRDVRSGILDYTNSARASHHLLASDANISLHFPKLREQENLRALETKQNTARLAAVQKKMEKLTAVEDFKKCCAR